MLTVENVEKAFDKVCAIVGNELQGTSTYLMRANSIGEMAKELDMSVEDITSKLYVKDKEGFKNHAGAIIWADYDKEDFCVMLDDTELVIYNFVSDVRR